MDWYLLINNMPIKKTRNEHIRAACLTPPRPGGVAVIQVIGREAREVVAAFLDTGKKPSGDLPADGELRLCRIVEGDKTIDDALITARSGLDGNTVIDISLHGGPRIVQRVLLLLKKAGVAIVEPSELPEQNWYAADSLEAEMSACLLRAKTRRAACWLVGVAEGLRAEIEGIISQVEKGDLDAGRNRIENLLAGAGMAGFVLAGVRVVLIGEPNTGKSTLANALAGREHAIVSEVPGTTRDWVEHPGAINGIPFTFVDTAGLGESGDPIEAEAVRRAHEQSRNADMVLRVIDSSVPPTPAEYAAIEELTSGPTDSAVRSLFVWNKCDCPLHPDHRRPIRDAGDLGIRVSALTGAGIEDLRGRISEIMGFGDFDGEGAALVTGRQLEACENALFALNSGIGGEALVWLRFMLNKSDIRPEEGFLKGYN